MNDQERLDTLRQPSYRRLGLAITALSFGLLSWGVGLGQIPSPKPDGPADGNRPRSSSKMNIPALWSEMYRATKAITATDGNGTATKKAAEQPAESMKTSTDPKPDPQPAPKPDLEPWPPETLAWAGKEAGDESSANGLQMKFCWCPAGTFTMGSPKDEKDRANYEGQVQVTLTRGFWLAKYETTQAQWQQVMGTTLLQQADVKTSQFWWETDNPGSDTWWDRNQRRWQTQRRQRYASEVDFGEGPSRPMYYVNHLEATDFCVKLTQQERRAGRLPPGWEYRLPTEAQWEYACRAGTTTATAFGDKLSSRQANFNGDLPYNGAEKGPTPGRFRAFDVYRPGQMQPVGSYRPNAWGLCDMHGNAWEWCRDWYGVHTGGMDPEIKFGDMGRAVRGGSWSSAGKHCRSATHHSPFRWSTQDSVTGFRVAIVQLDPQPKPAPEPPATPLPEGILINSLGMKLAPIPAGKFLMGSPVEEVGRPWLGRDEADYEEQHPVTIREPFYLGVYLVTQEQYQQLMASAPGYEPSYFSHEGEGKDKVKQFEATRQFPRENVSWKDAQEFCRRLSELPAEKLANRRYRLPTEEEWEYACRAGTSTPYYFGQTISQQQANFNVSNLVSRFPRGNNLDRTTPVGQYSPNEFGLYDMHGNLGQWCEDLYAPYPKDQRNPNHYQGYAVRGGSWGYSDVWCRSASRGKGWSLASRYYGFRVAVSVASGTQ